MRREPPEHLRQMCHGTPSWVEESRKPPLSSQGFDPPQRTQGFAGCVMRCSDSAAGPAAHGAWRGATKA
jgi:hypothetical protein